MNNMHYNRNNNNRSGAALIVVLFIVMVATILSLGFLSRSDTELSCGANMMLKTQTDYLAESGLEYAKGLIVSDSNFVSSWAVERQQLYTGSDYYDVNVVSLTPPDPNQPSQVLSFQVASKGYREKNGDKIGESILTAQLCVDPLAGAFFRSITR
jgi:hypothetical protein